MTKITGILTGKDSNIDGFSSVKFDLPKALSILHTMQAQGCVYGLGSKARSLSVFPPVYSHGPGKSTESIDCSGFFRYVLYQCAGVTVPDGSFVQNDFLAEHGFKHHVIDKPNSPDYLYSLDSRFVYACFCKTGSRHEVIGHVWLIAFISGAWWTMESYGGNGPGQRHYNTPVLARIITDLYPIAKVG